MEYVALIIPVIACLILLIWFRKQTVIWEYTWLLVPTLIIFFGVRAGMVSYKQTDTEYLGYYVTGIQHYEKWDEWIDQTCSSTDGDGNTTYYDCSYKDTHYEYWTKYLNDGSEHSISEQEYNSFLYRWGTPKKFIEMNRDFYRIDGDAYYNAWNNKPYDTGYVTHEGSYTNKIKASSSIFNFKDIDNGDVEKYKLWEYPEIKNDYQNTILAKHYIAPIDQKNWDYLNALNGKQYEFRSFIIYFYNQDKSVVDKQLSYWKGVNMNEMNIFIGVDSVTNKCQWFRIESWSDRPELEVELRNYVNSSDTITISDISNYITPKLSSKWHRKDFKEFNYIDIELTSTQLNWLILILLLYNIGMSFFIIVNDYNNQEKINYRYY